jgi:hypothetical protein
MDRQGEKKKAKKPKAKKEKVLATRKIGESKPPSVVDVFRPQP